MAVKSYSYVDADGQAQSVNVTVTISACQSVQIDPYSTGLTYQKRSTISISIPAALPVPLYVHFDKTDTVTANGVSTPTTNQVTIKVPRGATSQVFDFICDQQFLGSSIRQQTSYTFLDQPASPDVDEEQENEQEPQQENIQYSVIPAYLFEFRKTTQGYDDKLCRIEIYKKSYDGATKEISYMQSQPVSVRTKGDPNDLYKPILGSSLTINLLAFEQNEYRDLFTSQDGQAKLLYYEDDVLKFEGYNIAEYYRTNLSSKIQFTEVVFSDGIALLKNKPFIYPTDVFRKNILDVFWHIMRGIDSTKHLLDKCYVYPTTLEYDIKKSPFEYLEVDIRTYKDDDGEPFTCYQVLESILKPFGCRLYSTYDSTNTACWAIEEVNARSDGGLKWRKYNNGSVEASDTRFSDAPGAMDFRRGGKIQPGFNFIINRSRNQRIKPAIHAATITKNLEFIPDLVPSLRNAGSIEQLVGWSFTGGTDYATMLFIRDVIGSHLQLSSKLYEYNIGGLAANSDFTNVKPVADNSGYAESEGTDVYAESGNTVGFTVNAGVSISSAANSLLINNLGRVDSFLPIQVIIESELQTYYLSYIEGNDTAAFQTSETHIYLRAKQYQVSPDLSTVSFVIPAAEIPVDGVLKFRIHRPNELVIYNGSLFVPYEAKWFVGVIDEEYQTTKGYTSSKEILYADAVVKNNFDRYETEIIHADVDTLQNVSALTASGTLTTLWEKYRRYNKEAQSVPLAQLLAQSVIENQYNAENWILEDVDVLENGGDYTNFNLSFLRAITFEEPGYTTKRFICYDYEYIPRPASNRGYGALIRGTWVEVSDAQPLIEYDVDTQDSKSNRRTSGSRTINNSTTTVVQNPFDPKSVALVQQNVVNTLPVIFDTAEGKYVVDVSTLSAGGGGSIQDTNTFVDSVQWLASTGQLVLSRTSLNGPIAPLEVNLDGRYIRTESDPTVPSHVKTITQTEKTNWNTAYNANILSAAVTGTNTKTLTLNLRSGSTITAQWTDLVGEVGASDGNDFIDSITRSGSSLILGYNNAAIPNISVNLGYTSTNITNWNTAYNDKINSISFSGTGVTKTLILNQQDNSNLQAAFDIPVPTLNEVATQGREINNPTGISATLNGALVVTRTNNNAVVNLKDKTGGIDYNWNVYAGLNDRDFSIVDDSAGFITRLRITKTGQITIGNLAGTGNRLLYSTSNGTLANWTIGNGLEIGSGALRMKGTRTANYIPVINSTNDGLNNSVLFQSNNKIGLGTTSPAHEIDIRNAGTATTTINLQNAEGNALIGINESGHFQLSSASGSNVILWPGTGGLLRLLNLPTSAPATANALWNDNGTLKIS